jgi:exportin-T
VPNYPVNKPRFETFISSLIALAVTTTDRTDRTAQRGALQVIRLTISAWGSDPAVVHGPTMFLTDVAAKEANGKDKKANGNSNGSTPTAENATQILPGYQQTVYDRLVPEIFGMIMSPDLNSKDGQSQLVSWLGKEFKSKAHDICQVLHEVSSLLREIMIARGQEGIDFLLTFLTSKQCPLPAAQELVRRMRSEILRDFRRTFSDFIKDWKVALGLTQ